MAGEDAAEDDESAALLEAAASNRVEPLWRFQASRGHLEGVRDAHQQTLLHHAAMRGSDDVLAFLLQGPRVARQASAPDELRRTPLHLAAAMGHDSCVRRLVDAGAAVDARDHAGATPLHLAVSLSWRGAASALLQAGADAWAPDRAGNTAAELAAKGGDAEMAALLAFLAPRPCRAAASEAKCCGPLRPPPRTDGRGLAPSCAAGAWAARAGRPARQPLATDNHLRALGAGGGHACPAPLQPPPEESPWPPPICSGARPRRRGTPGSLGSLLCATGCGVEGPKAARARGARSGGASPGAPAAAPAGGECFLPAPRGPLRAALAGGAGPTAREGPPRQGAPGEFAVFQRHAFFGEKVGRLEFEVVWQPGQPRIGAVRPGGEGSRRGVAEGDRLVEIGGVRTSGKSRAELLPLLGARPVMLRLDREEEVVDPEEPRTEVAAAVADDWLELGLELVKRGELPVVSRVAVSSAAWRAGIMEGDAVVTVGGQHAEALSRAELMGTLEERVEVVLWRRPLGMDPAAGWVVERGITG